MLSIGFMRSSMAQGYELTCMHSNTVVNVSVGQSSLERSKMKTDLTVNNKYH